VWIQKQIFGFENCFLTFCYDVSFLLHNNLFHISGVFNRDVTKKKNVIVSRVIIDYVYLTLLFSNTSISQTSDIFFSYPILENRCKDIINYHITRYAISVEKYCSRNTHADVVCTYCVHIRLTSFTIRLITS
jgi:hypothetical protein